MFYLHLNACSKPNWLITLTGRVEKKPTKKGGKKFKIFHYDSVKNESARAKNERVERKVCLEFFSEYALILFFVDGINI